MTEPDKVARANAEAAAQEQLRTELLTSGLYDWVPMIEVTTTIAHYHLAETLSQQQDLALRTIRSLLDDGLMQIGDLPGPTPSFRHGTSR